MLLYRDINRIEWFRYTVDTKVKKLFLIFVVWRAIVFAVGAIAPTFLQFRPDFGYTEYSYYLEKKLPSWQEAIEPWANFDGVHYLHIASRGYDNEWRFFPLFPMLIWTLSLGSSSVVLPIGFFISQLIAWTGIYWLYRLMRLDFSAKKSLHIITLLLIFPTSFFFGAVYTESFFLLLATGSLYAARTHKWPIAGLLAIAASATRIVGIVLVPVLLIELWTQYSSSSQKANSYRSALTPWIRIHWKKIAIIMSGALGLILYMLYQQRVAGDPLLFLKGHTELGNSRSLGLVNPLQTGFRYLKILYSLSPKLYEWWIALLELGVFLIGTATLVLAWFQKMRPSYWWYCLLGFLIPTLSGTFTGLPRYVIILFPFFLSLALIKKKWLLPTYVLLALPWLVIFTALFARGYFVA